MPYDGRLNFRRPTDYTVNAVIVLLPAEGVTAKGTGLQDLGVQQMGGQSVHNYAAGAIPAGVERWNCEVSGKPDVGHGRRALERMDECRHRPGRAGQPADPGRTMVVPPEHLDGPSGHGRPFGRA